MKIENSAGADKNKTASSTNNDDQPSERVDNSESAKALKSNQNKVKNESKDKPNDGPKSEPKNESKNESNDGSKSESKNDSKSNKPETNAKDAVQNEAKHEMKNDVKNSTKSDAKTEAKTEAKSEAKNDVKKAEAPRDQPTGHSSEIKSDNKSTSKTVANKKNTEEDYHEKLLRVLKKEVKQIMEEAVTKKVVNEESGSITSLCAAVDACLAHGLKRRALGLFKTNSTTALLQKCSKNCESASKVYKIVTELEKMLPKGSSSSDSLNKFRLSLTKQTNASSSVNTNNLSNVGNLSIINGTGISATNTRYLWIRIALFEKHLYNIVEHLVANSGIYYEKEALVADIVGGQILVDLLIGPCTLDYSKMKNQDHIFIDPHADELVQRHNLISSPSSHGSPSCTSSPLTKTSHGSLRRAPLYLPYYKWFNFVNSSSSGSTGSHDTNSSLTQSVDNHVDEFSGCGSPVHASLAQRLSLNSPFSPKEYVESLHQNCKTTLLYGKNNVVVQPCDNSEPLAGYLSLHQSTNNLEIRWTPNQLMKGKRGDKEKEQEDVSIYWDYALNIFVRETVYLHCHHNEQGGVAVFIGHDGVQKPSIKFPKGSHLLAFLTCLESGLMPHGQLDPPLGIQKGKGKVFPLIKRKRAKNKGKSNKVKNSDKSEEPENRNEDELTNDYVFRIIFNSLKPDTISEEMFNPKSMNGVAQMESSKQQPPLWKPKGFRQKLISTSSNSSTTSSKSMSDDFNSLSGSTTASSNSSLQTVCETMKRQILSRAFYGWLAYTRHLKTVRTHLSALVNAEITSADDPALYKGLTEKQFTALQDEQGRITDVNQLLKLVYFGYCEPRLRRKVWPYLLGHYDFKLTKEQREEQDEEMKQNYELLMTEWLAVEAIVKIRDKENLTASLAKFNSEEHRTSNGTLEKDHLDDVFRENGSETSTTKSGESKVKRNSERSSNFLIEKMFKDVIEEDENCDECKFDEAAENANEGNADSRCSSATLKRQRNVYTQSSTQAPYATNQILITGASTDAGGSLDFGKNSTPAAAAEDGDSSGQLGPARTNADSRNDGQLSADHSTCVSPASSNGGVYTNELLDIFSLNIHRIEKDVQRCDRNYPFFMDTKNLEKLRNIICTYVWKNLSNGYVQGMCDLVAPLLVILEDEMLTYSCFCELMKRMSANFPYSVAMNSMDNMDIHFANMRSLIQILDPELFELMHSNGDYTHFYFCYRWFLLDFKREFNYDDVFKVWECIWASKTVASPNMVLFIALALVQQYRDIILENNMDFCEIIRFFNEFAEKHDVDAIIENARKLVFNIQALIS